MKTPFVLALTTSLLSTFAFAQNTLKDAEQIKKLTGKELAGAYGSIYYEQTNTFKLELLKGDAYENGIRHSYVIADLDNNGKNDLIAVLEDAPSENDETGTRTVQVYLADQSGKLNLISEGKRIVRRLDEGGVKAGDPFEGISLDKDKAITIKQFGGSRETWTYKHMFKLLNINNKMDVYQVGSNIEIFDTATGKQTTTTIDYTTGKKTVHKLDFEANTGSQKTTQLPVKALLPLSKVVVE